MSLSAFAVINPQEADVSKEVLEQQMGLSTEAVQRPQIGQEVHQPTLLVKLQGDSVRSISEFASKWSSRSWGYGVLVDEAYGIRKVRQHFRGLTSVKDSSGRPRDWHWSDPHYMQALLKGTNKLGCAEKLFGVPALYVFVDAEGTSCLRWADGQVEVFEQ